MISICNKINFLINILNKKKLFFVVLGPHGVGKTTTLSTIKNKKNNLDIQYIISHHLQYKKNKKTIIPKKKNTKKNIKKFFPFTRFLKILLISIYNELFYANNIRKIINSNCEDKQVVIFDRYIYDRYIDLTINNKNKLAILLTKVSSYLLYKPTYVFILNDTPEKIYIRNQEYSISDIIKYQKSIIRFCDKLSIKYEIIDFNGRDHIEISTLLMHKLNEKIIDNEI